MKPTIDYSVVERFKAGDELAYDEIYNAYRNTVYFMAYNYFHDSGMAEDIVQDTFISLLKYIDKIDSIEGLGLYIRKICYHRSMDKLRRKKLNTIEDTEEYTVEDRTDNKELVASATDHEINDAIMDSLGRLDFDLKSVGILRFYEQLSIDDIAEILTIPAGTVKSRINRLRTILQEDLTKVGVTPEMYRSALSTGGLALIYQTMSSTALQKAMGAVTPLKSHSNKGKSTTITAISAVGSMRMCNWFRT
ncbi:MAG: sigma-70 family RNA polymerase sigma factor [Thomasclavelia sp.]|nr:sigma-70 family RNA polymerase sigma factor [Thomasclavelia sp.]